MEKEIKSVKGSNIGDIFLHDKLIYVAIKFPTRYSVVGRRVPDSGEPQSCKVPISKVKWQRNG